MAYPFFLLRIVFLVKTGICIVYTGVARYPNNIVTAMSTQAMDTYGESLSPILEAFQKSPVKLRVRLCPGTRRHCLPRFVTVQKSWHLGTNIGTCAYEEQYDEEKGLKIEQGRL